MIIFQAEHYYLVLLHCSLNCTDVPLLHWVEWLVV